MQTLHRGPGWSVGPKQDLIQGPSCCEATVLTLPTEVKSLMKIIFICTNNTKNDPVFQSTGCGDTVLYYMM